jgi:hypothetical protein
MAIANGVSLPRRTTRTPEQGAIAFVGSLRYGPNVEGLLWFASRVLPQLPRAKLLVAGAEPDPVLLRKRLGGRISYLGYTPFTP